MTWGESSALAPAGPQAARLAQVIWTFLGVSAVVYVVVMVLLVVALTRQDGAAFDEAGRLRHVAVGGAITALILLALLVVSVRHGSGLNPMRDAKDVLTVRVTARQWWWEFRYPGSGPDDEIRTANELHVPVGRPVLLELISRDVIHSFWVPALHGKRDLIPGHDSTTYIQADRAGVFRGQCAEFCGAQHAKMGFLVIAEAPDAFEAWRAQQHRPAVPPEQLSAAASRGRGLFLGGTCPMCHTVMGTTAGATMGPDLTHVASRQTLGAGSLPNVRQQLQSWVIDPHAVKPGTRMPPTALAATDVPDLVSYLEALQ
jgi:cytochrome c oxidase subunit 2